MFGLTLAIFGEVAMVPLCYLSKKDTPQIF
jgi:hypothetical protein